MGFTALSNGPVKAQIPEDDQYLLATKSYCDCGTALGGNYEPRPPKDLHRERRRHESEGWSATKLKSWEEQKRAAEQSRIQPRLEELKQDLRRWNEFLHEIVRPGRLPRLGLILHYYSGRLDSEDFALGKATVNIDEVDETFLREFREDVLYDIVH